MPIVKGISSILCPLHTIFSFKSLVVSELVSVPSSDEAVGEKGLWRESRQSRGQGHEGSQSYWEATPRNKWLFGGAGLTL